MLVVVGLAAVTLLGVRADLDEGRTALERSRRDLAQGDVAAAEATAQRNSVQHPFGAKT